MHPDPADRLQGPVTPSLDMLDEEVDSGLGAPSPRGPPAVRFGVLRATLGTQNWVTGSISRSTSGRRSGSRAALLEAQRDLAEANLSVIVIVAGVGGAGKAETVDLLLDWLDARHRDPRHEGSPLTRSGNGRRCGGSGGRWRLPAEVV